MKLVVSGRFVIGGCPDLLQITPIQMVCARNPSPIRIVAARCPPCARKTSEPSTISVPSP